jgi:hypothetical protein
MAYWFAGFFVKPPFNPPTVLPEGAVLRNITVPFVGVGVRVSALLGKTPSAEAVDLLAEQLGISHAGDWIYLTYTCWAGRIDSVYGLGSSGGQRFGPIEEDAVARTKDAYLQLMGEFGVSPEDALRFPPFERGFWGE